MKSALTILLICISLLSTSQTKEELNWIKANSKEIQLDDNDYERFEFLDSILKDKRIVMLGENTHGSSEYSLLKNRIIQYLHKKLGYNILTWESSLLDCYAVESLKTKLSPEEMANGSLHFAYKSKQILPLMNYIKNSDLILTGMDSQPTVYSDATAKFLQTHPCFIKLSREIYYVDSLAQTPSMYAWKDENRKILAAKYQDILNKIDKTSCLSDDLEIVIRGLKDRINDMLIRNKERDQRMADNLMWLLYNKYPKEKFIIYAHNAHIDRLNQKNSYANSKSMAEFLPDSVIKKSYCIEIFGYEGQARNNLGKKPIYDFKTHPKQSLENYLNQSGYNVTFLDLENQVKSVDNSFLFQKINTMYWGNIKDPKIVTDHYDGVIVIKKITPSVKIKSGAN
jgi:erythromycin esterase